MATMIDGFPSNYVTPSSIGTTYTLLNLVSRGNLKDYQDYYGAMDNGAAIKVENSNGTTYYYVDEDGIIQGDNTFIITQGLNNVTYYFYLLYHYGGRSSKTYETSTFTIVGGDKRYPLKPWTVNDVIQRVLQLAEPLRAGQNKRFRFTPPNDSKAALFSKNAPEFTFTRQTLREALQTIGGYIHAEPRLNPDNSISFDFYGGSEYATYKNYKTGEVKRLSEYKYTAMRGSYGLEQACNRLDSYMDNLVNRLNWEQATTRQPSTNRSQTMRTETAYGRFEENDSYIFPSAYAIDKIVSFEYVTPTGGTKDLTPYLYEKTVYDNLSSYSKVYPSSKAYALHYTQGEKGIKGFFFYPQNPDSSKKNNYAITNILNTVLNVSNDSYSYTELTFRLSYVPIYSTRIKHSKQCITEWLPLPRTLNYTQSENSVETRYFGENIKGMAARLGNIEKTYTFNMRNLYNIPKAGQLWDDDYYIASVSVEVNQDLFTVSCGLSKNFNRKSQYIGASSYKRIYEVSEKMVQERHSVYTDYIVFTDGDTEYNASFSPTYLRADEVFRITTSAFFNTSESDIYIFDRVLLTGRTKSGQNLNSVCLPVVASAFGNVMEFTWEYKDNYSAGVQAVDYSGDDENMKGTFGQEVQYADYYGRMYYLDWGVFSRNNSFITDSNLLPQYTGSLNYYGIAGTKWAGNPVIVRKDSREALKMSYQIEFVTDNDKMVLGSAIAYLNEIVGSSKHDAAVLYILQNRINKFANTIDLSTATRVAPFENIGQNGRAAPIDGVAWAYVIPQSEGDPYTVEDEDGNISTITPTVGGEVLLAKNEPFKAGDVIGAFKTFAVGDVYQYLKNKTKKEN